MKEMKRYFQTSLWCTVCGKSLLHRKESIFHGGLEVYLTTLISNQKTEKQEANHKQRSEF
jgi:hypothetical protein